MCAAAETSDGVLRQHEAACVLQRVHRCRAARRRFDAARQALLELTPAHYLGNAARQAREI